MACETFTKQGQTIAQRAAEISAAARVVSQGLTTGRVRAKIGPQGAIAFDGLSDEDRNGASDACIYRRIMATGSALARAKIEQAETLAGRKVDYRAVNGGHHSHDGGRTWHRGH
jgi:hypothetical protein